MRTDIINASVWWMQTKLTVYMKPTRLKTSNQITKHITPSYSSPTRLKFGFESIQHFILRRCKTHTKHTNTIVQTIEKTATYLSSHSVAQYSPHILNNASFCLSKYRYHHSHMKIGKFPLSFQWQRCKENMKLGSPDKNYISLWTWMKGRRKQELRFGW